MRAVEEHACAFLRARRELGSTQVTDHEGVSREDEPWLLGARAISHQKRDMLRRVPGHVKHAHLDVPEHESLVMLNGSVLVRRGSAVMQDVVGACLARECTPRRVVIRVDVRIDDKLYCESCLLRDAQVRRRCVDRIDDGGSRAPASAKEV